MRLQTVGLSLEVAQSCTTRWRDNEDSIEIPGPRQVFVRFKHAIGQKPRPDVALACFQLTQGVLRIDRINIQAETVLRLEDRPGPHQKLDARCQLRAGGSLELGKDGTGRGLPDDGPRLGQHRSVGVALRHFQVNMTPVDPDFHDLDQGPDPSLAGLRNSLRYIAQKTGKGNALFVQHRRRCRLLPN